MSDPIHSKVHFILSQIYITAKEGPENRDHAELFSFIEREARRGAELLNDGKEIDLTDRQFERLEKLIRVLARKLNKYQQIYRRETGQYMRVY